MDIFEFDEDEDAALLVLRLPILGRFSTAEEVDAAIDALKANLDRVGLQIKRHLGDEADGG